MQLKLLPGKKEPEKLRDIAAGELFRFLWENGKTSPLYMRVRTGAHYFQMDLETGISVGSPSELVPVVRAYGMFIETIAPQQPQ